MDNKVWQDWKTLDARLSAGETVRLSIDAGVQAVVAREIARQMDYSRPSAAPA